MENKVQSLHHLQGEQAYLIYWEQYYQCHPRLESVLILDLNLDIIVSDDCELLAYRFDYPESMRGMVERDGEWKIYNKENQSPEVLDKLRTLLVGLRFELCLN